MRETSESLFNTKSSYDSRVDKIDRENFLCLDEFAVKRRVDAGRLELDKEGRRAISAGLEPRKRPIKLPAFSYNNLMIRKTPGKIRPVKLLKKATENVSKVPSIAV